MGVNGKDKADVFDEYFETTPTIIDGVNESECKLYDYGICDSELAEDLNCEKNPDCYFKQLQRLKQENEKLKTENEQLKKPCLIMPKVNQLAIPIDEYKKLYKALEEIRDIVKPIKDNTCFGVNCGAVDWILDEVNEVLDAR